jgi:hypothetical protein
VQPARTKRWQQWLQQWQQQPLLPLLQWLLPPPIIDQAVVDVG